MSIFPRDSSGSPLVSQIYLTIRSTMKSLVTDDGMSSSDILLQNDMIQNGWSIRSSTPNILQSFLRNIAVSWLHTDVSGTPVMKVT